MTRFRAGAALLLMTAVVFGQTDSRRIIRAYGEGAIAVRPDQATLSVGVVTRAASAADAANQNADQSAKVIAALRELLGAGAEIRTISYSLAPNYVYPPGGGQPSINGFTASNTVEVTLTDLSLIGRVIDVAIGAGANRVDSLRMGLKDEDPVRVQALRLAGQRAKVKAEAIASGVGVRLGAVISAVEGYSVVPVTGLDRTAPGAVTTTPVEPGILEVRATVTLDLEAM
jgi:uncharacterized protein YggE